MDLQSSCPRNVALSGKWKGDYVRYLKGSVILSDHTDLPALRTVYQAGHATVRQVFRALHRIAGVAAPNSAPIAPGIVRMEKTLWDTFARRTRTLAQKGYLVRTAVADLDTLVLSLSREGEAVLCNRLESIVEVGTRSTVGNRRNQVRHDVELFEMYLQVRRSDIFQSWQFEPEIRAGNNYTADVHVKDFDAIVKFGQGERSAVVALEFERSPKRTQEYERIGQLLKHERYINAVVYATPTAQLADFVAHGFRNAMHKVYVTNAREFARDPASSALTDARTGRVVRITDLFSCA